MLGAISSEMYEDGHHPVSKAQPSVADDLSIRNGFYYAPVSITVFTPEVWEFGQFDTATSIENMTLAAWSLGIGSCCIARAELTFATLLAWRFGGRSESPMITWRNCTWSSGTRRAQRMMRGGFTPIESLGYRGVR